MKACASLMKVVLITVECYAAMATILKERSLFSVASLSGNLGRVSVLCFLGVDGIQECYQTEGTFDRAKFIEYCRQFVLSGKVESYPGRNSIWILDGARIHCHEDIIAYLRMMGIRPIFLPPYCPFFNPIEYLFGTID